MHPSPSYKSARLLIEEHGIDAAVVAALHADACDGEGDAPGRRAWLAAMDMVDALLWASPKS